MIQKQMFFKYILGVLILCNGILSAQEKATIIDSTSAEIKTLQKKTILQTDTIAIQNNKGDFSSTEIRTISKDSTFFDLQDDAYASKTDSLWMQELYNTNRFEELYGSIVNQNDSIVEYKELSTEVLKQRLEKINARTPFNVEYNPILESVIKNYLKSRRVTMGKLIALSDYYFPMFEQELDKHNLPLEIKYLAVVESALAPNAQSRVGAKGLWQFMFMTGKMYGLEVSSYVDERADPEMATEAASKYLKSLFKSFNDWDLALAAYNSGPGNVSKSH